MQKGLLSKVLDDETDKILVTTVENLAFSKWLVFLANVSQCDVRKCKTT